MRELNPILLMNLLSAILLVHATGWNDWLPGAYIYVMSCCYLFSQITLILTDGTRQGT